MLFLFAMAVLLAATPALAQKPGDTVTPAALGKLEWIQGRAPAEWEDGTVYLLECWATWCGPCIAAIPHVDALHDNYKPKGLRVIGVNVWEDGKDKVAAFVKKKGDGMSYPVAYTGRGGAFEAEWLKPAGVTGIPRAFLVKDGKVLVSTHPARITEAVIEALLEGGEAEEKAIGSILKAEEGKAKAGGIGREIRTALSNRDFATAEAKIAEVKASQPDSMMVPMFTIELHLLRNEVEAAETTFKGIADPKVRNLVAYNLTMLPNSLPADLPAGFRNELADSVEEIAAGATQPEVWLKIARLRWSAGAKDRAVAAAGKAAEVAPKAQSAAYREAADAIKAGEMPDEQTVKGWLQEAASE